MNSDEEKLFLKKKIVILALFMHYCGEKLCPYIQHVQQHQGGQMWDKEVKEADEELLTCRDVDAAPMSKPRD